MLGYPTGGRDRILDGGRKFVFGREAVVHGNKAAAGGLCKRRRDAVMGLDTAARPCRRHGRRRSPARVACRRHRRAHKGGKRRSPAGPGNDAVDPGRGRHVGACELHEFRQAPGGGHSRSAAPVARRGRRHHGEKTLRQGIEGHSGSGRGISASSWSINRESIAIAGTSGKEILREFRQ